MKNKRQMKNLTLAKYYKMKWERRSVLVNNTFGLKYISKGLREWYYLNLKKNNTILSVVIEYDGSKPEYGIYYGIRTKEGNLISNEILDVVKSDYYRKYWKNRNPTDSIDSVKNVFLPDNGEISEDGTYWPFWIRLEEKYNIDEAFVGAKVIIESLVQQKFEIIGL